MKNFMNSIRIQNNRKNWFDLTHDVKCSFKMGYLYPNLCMEVLPGEKVILGCESLVRFDPMVFATMHRYKMRMDYFFVPNRIGWPNWEDFITHKATPPGAPPAHPTFTVLADGSNYTELMDHMGVPKPLAGQTTNEDVNAFPFVAYQRIWNDYYRQDYIIPEAQVLELLDGANTSGHLTTLRKVAWEHDYFTSCLPTPQHGVPVEIPINVSNDPEVFRNSAGGGDSRWTNDVTAVGTTVVDNQATTDPDVAADGLYVDGAQIDNTTLIEDLRRASAIQKFFERLMRTGRRYKEVLLAAFGQDGGDARLQRPEFIMRVQNPVVISEVLNTSDTANAPQGSIAGHGIGVTEGKYATYTAREHGLIIGVMSLVPMSGYQNGIQGALYPKASYTDYFWSEFANLGEESIQQRELFAYGPNTTQTFGYLPRYSRLRTLPNRVAGQFRDTKSAFHHGRIFTAASIPVLDQDFIECTPGKRIFAVTNPAVDELSAMVVHKIKKLSPVPKFGTPTLS